MNIIEELYYGNVVPNETNAKLSAELKELIKLLNRNEDDLLKTLSDEQKNIFEKLKDCNREISDISEREAFLCGFQLGARIIIEVVNN
ncbi:MAG: hypothetical protein UHK60_07415 [Acutalibacteraceae bacterium]|nr:hypothetical protein [Acutalibacteraceae bacterium]